MTKMVKNSQKWKNNEENSILINKVKLKQIFANQLGVVERVVGEL